MFASYAGLHQALGGSNTCIAPCLHRVLLGVLHTAWPTQLCSYSSVQEECNSTGLNLADMPRHIILLRHGEVRISKFTAQQIYVVHWHLVIAVHLCSLS